MENNLLRLPVAWTKWNHPLNLLRLKRKAVSCILVVFSEPRKVDNHVGYLRANP